jgi:N-acetylmuramoyl-L-alanine amidase
VAGRDPEWPSDGGAERRSVSRRRFVGFALLAGLVPGGAAAAEWLRGHRGGPHAPLASGRPADTTRPAGTARPADTAQGSGAGQPAATVHQAKAQAAEARAPALPLAGKVVVIDPGHNPNNPQHVAEIDSLVQAGGFLKACDTVGAETDAGYPEFDFTLDVARQARAILRAAGAKVILTQNGRTVYGPCVDVRAAIGNRAHADAALSIHADGGPPDGYGFAMLVPVLIQNGVTDNSAIIEPSSRLADAFLTHFAAVTGQNRSTYLGVNGIQPRSDLGGLNLSTVPKVFIECANMRNAQDAVKVTSPAWRQLAARGIAESISAFLTAA